MSMYIKGGRFISDGSDVAIPVGFVPDYVRVMSMNGGDTGVEYFEWYRHQEDTEASGTQEGISRKEGVTADMADGAGIVEYDTSGSAPTITSWTTSVSSGATAKTSTAVGTYVKPSTSSSADRELVFECVTAGTGGSTEPTWNTGIGEYTTDGSTVFECVRPPKRASGYKGFLFYGDAQTNSDVYYWHAFKFDEFVDEGDVDGWPSGVKNG